MGWEALVPLGIEVLKAGYDVYQQNQQNKYNSPQGQMKRYMQAGINPAWAMANPSIDAGNQQGHPNLDNLDADKLSSYYKSSPKMQRAMTIEQYKGMYLDNQMKTQNIEAQTIQNQMMNDEAAHKDDYWTETVKNIQQAIKSGKSGQALTIAQRGLVNAQTGTERERQNLIKQQALKETYKARIEGMLAEDPYMYTGEFTVSAELAGTINSAMDAGLISAGYGISGKVRAGMKMTPSQFAHVCDQLGAKIKTKTKPFKPKPLPEDSKIKQLWKYMHFDGGKYMNS